MRFLITHDTIARELLNRGFSSGCEKIEAWAVPLTNCDDV